MKRGEIWIASGGAEYLGKPRPMVIVQDERFDATDSITLCPCTTTIAELSYFRVLLNPRPENGLREPTEIMVDKISTIARTKLSARIGVLSSEELDLTSRAIAVFLGISRR